MGRVYIDTRFDTLAQGQKDMRSLTERNALAAVKDIIKAWRLILPVDKEQRLLTNRFRNSWNKMAEDGRLDVRDAVAFMRDLMTTPLITIQLHNRRSSLTQKRSTSLSRGARGPLAGGQMLVH